MTTTHQHTTLIYKGQPGNWCGPYQVDQPTPDDIYQGWEIVGISSPELRGSGEQMTMDYLIKAYQQFHTDVPQPLLDYMKQECELIPITVTYTY